METRFNNGRGGPTALDWSVAALAALSVGFAIFAMPDPLFTRLVGASGIAGFVEAARPPLGDTARFSVVAAGAIAVFALVFLLLRALDRSAAPPRAIEADPFEEAPRLRRADAHPDAPPRRPLLAGHELGEPETPAAAAPAPEQRAPEPRPLPAFLLPTQPDEEDSTEAEPPASVTEPTIEAAEPEESEDSVAKLMSRLERGLSRRRKTPAIDHGVSAIAPPPLDEDRVGHRLRSAISELQKMAARPG